MRVALLPTLILLTLAPLAQAQTPAPAEAAPAAATPAAETNKPLAVVNGKEIPALYGELVKREMAQGQSDSPQLDARVRESLVNLELLSRAALDKGLDKNPQLAAMLDIRRKDQLAKAYLEDYVKAHPVSDAEIQTTFDKAKAEPVEPEYRARHILVKTEAAAHVRKADLDLLRIFHGGADDLALQVRRRLLPLGQHRRLDLRAPVHPAALEAVGRM